MATPAKRTRITYFDRLQICEQLDLGENVTVLAKAFTIDPAYNTPATYFKSYSTVDYSIRCADQRRFGMGGACAASIYASVMRRRSRRCSLNRGRSVLANLGYYIKPLPIFFSTLYRNKK